MGGRQRPVCHWAPALHLGGRLRRLHCAAHRPRGAPAPSGTQAFAGTGRWIPCLKPHAVSWHGAAGGTGRGDFRGDEERRFRGLRARAPCALRLLTHRGCLNGAAQQRSEFRDAAPEAEHRSGVGAKRRPPRHEPPARSPGRASPAPPRKRAGQSRKIRRSGSAPDDHLLPIQWKPPPRQACQQPPTKWRRASSACRPPSHRNPCAAAGTRCCP